MVDFGRSVNAEQEEMVGNGKESFAGTERASLAIGKWWLRLVL